MACHHDVCPAEGSQAAGQGAALRLRACSPGCCLTPSNLTDRHARCELLARTLQAHTAPCLRFCVAADLRHTLHGGPARQHGVPRNRSRALQHPEQAAGAAARCSKVARCSLQAVWRHSAARCRTRSGWRLAGQEARGMERPWQRLEHIRLDRNWYSGPSLELQPCNHNVAPLLSNSQSTDHNLCIAPLSAQPFATTGPPSAEHHSYVVTQLASRLSKRSTAGGGLGFYPVAHKQQQLSWSTGWRPSAACWPAQHPLPLSSHRARGHTTACAAPDPALPAAAVCLHAAWPCKGRRPDWAAPRWWCRVQASAGTKQGMLYSQQSRLPTYCAPLTAGTRKLPLGWEGSPCPQPHPRSGWQS